MPPVRTHFSLSLSLPLTGEVDPDFSKKTLKLVKEETM